MEFHIGQFGYREFDMGADLLKLMSDNRKTPAAQNVFYESEDWVLGNDPSSGDVFLFNEDTREVLMVNYNEDPKKWIVEWYISCRDCHNRSTESEFEPIEGCEGCAEQQTRLEELRENSS